MNDLDKQQELEKVRAFFYKDLYASEATGCILEEIGDFYAKCSLTLENKHRNGYGAVMGGAIFTLADFTFAVATNHDGEKVVSLTSQISFLSSSKGTKLFAEAKLIKDGRSTCLYEVEVTDDLGAKIGFVTITGMKLK